MKFDNPHEQHCFDNAAYFTTVRGSSPRTRTKTVHATLEKAEAVGIADGKTMIYAVTEIGLSAHIKNV